MRVVRSTWFDYILHNMYLSPSVHGLCYTTSYNGQLLSSVAFYSTNRSQMLSKYPRFVSQVSISWNKHVLLVGRVQKCEGKVCTLLYTYYQYCMCNHCSVWGIPFKRYYRIYWKKGNYFASIPYSSCFLKIYFSIVFYFQLFEFW